MSSTALEDLLLRARLLSPMQIAVAKRDAEMRRKRLAATIIDLGLIDETRFAQWISEATGAPLVDPLPEDSVFALERRLPRAIAREFEVVPIALSGAALTVATIDPTDAAALDILHTTTGLTIRPAVARYSGLMRLVTRFYPEDDPEQTILPAPFPEPAAGDRSPFDLGSQTLVARPASELTGGSATQILTPKATESQLDRLEKKLAALEAMIESVQRRLESIESALNRTLPR